jgi:RNase P/RNase MRP subunit POP5
MKIKRRYLALKIESAEKFKSRDFLDALWDAVLRLYGEYGASRIGLTLIDYDEEKGQAIIRVIHTEVEKVKATLASITEIMAEPVAIHVLAVSGTLRALARKSGTNFKQQSA